MKKLIIIIAALVFAGCGGSGTKQADSESKKADIEIVSQNLKQDEFSTTVYVVLKNNTNKTASYIDIQSFFYDEQGNVLGSGLGNATEIAGGASKTIEIMCVDDVSAATQYKVELGNVVW